MDEAAVMTKPSGKELVAVTKILSPDSTPVALEQVAMSDEDAVMFTLANVQTPKFMPAMVLLVVPVLATLRLSTLTRPVDEAVERMVLPVKVETPVTARVLPRVAAPSAARVVEALTDPPVTTFVLMVVTAFAVRVMTSTPNVTARTTEIIFVILSLLTMFILT